MTPPDGSLAELTCRKSLAHAEASSESENYEGGGFENNTLFYFFYFYASEGVLVVSSFLAVEYCRQLTIFFSSKVK